MRACDPMYDISEVQLPGGSTPKGRHCTYIFRYLIKTFLYEKIDEITHKVIPFRKPKGCIMAFRTNISQTEIKKEIYSKSLIYCYWENDTHDNIKAYVNDMV